MHSEKAEEVSGRLVRGCATFAFPEGGTEVITFGEDSALTDVEAMGEGVQVEEATSEFEVGVGDGATRVGVGDETIDDVLGPLETPCDGSSADIAVARGDGGAGKPNATRAGP